MKQDPFYGNMTGENRWDEKAGLLTGCGVRSQVIDVLDSVAALWNVVIWSRP
jgi:hypothetical protein